MNIRLSHVAVLFDILTHPPGSSILIYPAARCGYNSMQSISKGMKTLNDDRSWRSQSQCQDSLMEQRHRRAQQAVFMRKKVISAKAGPVYE